MSTLLANRWFRWTLLASALSGLGVGIYRFTPPEPMCVIELAANSPNKLSGDGQRLATISGVMNAWRGPLQLWDTGTGEEIGRFLADERNLNHYVFSENGSCFAAEVTREENGALMGTMLHLVDFAMGTTRTLPVPGAKSSWLQFSPSGAILVRRLSKKAWHGIEIYETASGKLLHQRTTDPFRLSKDTDDIALCREARFSLSLDMARDHFPELDATRDTERSYYHPMVEVTNDKVLYHVPMVQADQESAEKKKDLEIWSVPERKVVATLPGVEDSPLLIGDGRQILVGRTLPNGKWASHWTVWDVALGRAVAEFPLLMKAQAAVSPDGRWLAGLAREKPQIELRELATGKLLGVSEKISMHQSAISHDGRFLALRDGPTWTIIDVPTMKSLWTPPGFSGWPEVFFSRDSRMVAPRGYGGKWSSLDCETGRSFSLSTDPNPDAFCVPTPDRKSMLVQQILENKDMPAWVRLVRSIPWLNRQVGAEGHQWITRVLDSDTRHERFQLRGEAASMAILSDDGGTLVTTHSEQGDRQVVRCWNVNAEKPVHWALSVPAGLAAAIGLFAWRRGRRAVKAA